MCKYKSRVISIGSSVEELLGGNILILFGENAPEELKEYSVIHEARETIENIMINDRFYMGETIYTITSFGDLVLEHLSTLGHVTLYFDGAGVPKMKGAIHLKEMLTSIPKPGEYIRIEES